MAMIVLTCVSNSSENGIGCKKRDLHDLGLRLTLVYIIIAYVLQY